MRIDPPPSAAAATGTMPAATAAAAPPDEPPGVCSGFQGLRAGPNARGSVMAFRPNSGTLVLPNTTSPESSQRRTTASVCCAGSRAMAALPWLVGTPARSLPRSLSRNGTPAKGAAGCGAAARNCARARSRRSVMTAFSWGLTASQRTRAASSASAGLSSPSRMRAASSSASNGSVAFRMEAWIPGSGGPNCPVGAG
ncbi:hypothetical protein GALL_469100 [mine drainage metagenome]|uniref:Uncharacterized protein n=1 Tax=mine drainage metagenome TaxID=410659 RepID=A0A1J5PIY0_9ZZZZ